jgi:hypothetical protein
MCQKKNLATDNNKCFTLVPPWVPQSIEIGLSFSAVGCNLLESQLLVMALGQNINQCLVFGESHATVIRGLLWIFGI